MALTGRDASSPRDLSLRKNDRKLPELIGVWIDHFLLKASGGRKPCEAGIVL
jgi:hypothetical protein